MRTADKDRKDWKKWSAHHGRYAKTRTTGPFLSLVRFCLPFPFVDQFTSILRVPGTDYLSVLCKRKANGITMSLRFRHVRRMGCLGCFVLVVFQWDDVDNSQRMVAKVISFF